MPKRWMVTGGAGFIGSHVVRSLLERGTSVVVVDDLSSGSEERLPNDAGIFQLDVRDTEVLHEVMCTFDVQGVIHLAGLKQARESVRRPMDYWSINLGGMVSVLEACSRVGVSNLVFSSTCAVYGNCTGANEGTPPRPESPYGFSKLAAEWLLADACRAHGMKYVALRYFNVIGCDDFPNAIDTGTDNVLPRFVGAVERDEPMLIYGNKFPTPDGTCVRDYIDVRDVAAAHVLAAEALTNDREIPRVINLASGRPLSVHQIANIVSKSLPKIQPAPRILPAKPGDPAAVWASGEAAKDYLGWEPTFSVEDSIRSHLAAAGLVSKNNGF